MAIALGLTLLWAQPPTPKPADSPSGAFSAGRALSVLERLLADEAPHPSGREANAQVAERIGDELTALGLPIEMQETFACSSLAARCGSVSNVMTRLPGQRDGPAVLLTAHYDSVPAGPGAADDMAGVAVLLEIARILREEPPASPVILLFSDGEEPGLLGAEAFMAEHPWAADVGVVVNLEANGVRGQSILFETAEGNAWLIEAFAAQAPRPVANSLFYEVYKLLPHNTDLTVYRSAGLPGVNFAITEGGVFYHTPLDNMAHLDAGSVQHHGDNALAAVRAFASRDLSSPPPGNSIFVDVLPGMLLRWPEPWTVGIALANLGVWLAIAVVTLRRGEVTGKRILIGGCVVPASAAAAALLGFALAAGLIWLTGAMIPWFASPLPTRAAVWIAALLALTAVSWTVGRRAGYWGTALGVRFWWGLLSLAAAVLLPGVSILFLIPLTPALLPLALVAWTPLARSERATALAALVGLFVASWMWLPLALTGESFGLGAEMGAMAGFAVAMAASGLAPLLAVRELPRREARFVLAGTAAMMVLAFIVALLVPVYSPSAPQRINVMHIEDRSMDAAFWALEGDILAANGRAAVPATLLAAAPFDEPPIPFLPWSERRLLLAPAPSTDAPAPTVEILTDEVTGDERLVTLRLRSPRGGDRIALYVTERGALRRVDLVGTDLAVENVAAEKGYQAFECFGTKCDGLELTLHLAGRDALTLLLADSAPSLPPGGDAIRAARPESTTASQEGDRSLLIDWISLDAA